MNINNPAPPGEDIPIEQPDIGHVFQGGHSFNNSFSVIRPPPFWRPHPPPHFHGYGPRPFPFPPVHQVPPFGCGPPVFNVPPPPFPILHEKPEVCYHRTADQVWLKSWLQSQSFQPSSSEIATEQVSISEARGKLKACLQTLKELEGKHRVLQDGINSLSNENWNSLWDDVGKRQANFSNMTSLSFSGKPLAILQKKVLKQARKRSRLKRQHAQRKKDEYLAQLRRQNLHKKADAWLADMQLAVDKGRKNEELKKEADCVLAEVTRRQSEGRRQIALLEALQKLHQARIQTIQARGSKLSADDSKNCEHSRMMFVRLLDLWAKKMEEYSKEEQGLRVMLEESAAKQSDLEIQNIRRILLEWESCLFGSENNISSDELFDIDTLVSIRYAWDQYLVSDGVSVPMVSTIPVGWVLPTTPSSSEWQQLLAEK